MTTVLNQVNGDSAPASRPARSENPLMGFPSALGLTLLFFIVITLLGYQRHIAAIDPDRDVRCAVTVLGPCQSSGNSHLQLTVRNGSARPVTGTVEVFSLGADGVSMASGRIAVGPVPPHTVYYKNLCLPTATPPTFRVTFIRGPVH